MMENTLPAKTITALLPLCREHANTPAMIHHAMLLIKKFLNPGKQGTNDLFNVIDTLWYWNNHRTIIDKPRDGVNEWKLNI